MTDEVEKINKITSKSTAAGAREILEAETLPEKQSYANKEKFDDAMKLERSAQDYRSQEELKTTLMDEVRNLNMRVNRTSKYTPDELAMQSKKVIAEIEDLKGKLQNPDLELKRSYQTILRNKLQHIDDSLRVALDKAGLEYQPPEVIKSTLQSPIERFLGFLTHGQAQMERLNGEVQTLAAKREQLSPADLLAIQLKVGYMQQELEFFSSLLNKALESTKTIMNVQV